APPTTHTSLSFFNDTPTTKFSTLSLHDALPISPGRRHRGVHPVRSTEREIHKVPALGREDVAGGLRGDRRMQRDLVEQGGLHQRSEEHTSELQSRGHLVWRLLR